MIKDTISSASKALDLDSSEGDVSFLLKLSHELKTPIHGISGISTYLNSNWDELDDETRRKCLEGISSASESLVKLVNTLLEKTSNKEQINFDFKEVDLIKTTESVVESCKNLYINKKNIKIQLETEISNCLSIADSFWYGQVLTNLISNSINYSDKGTITVIFTTKKINKINHCVISVRDEGIGIPDAELDTIFMPFNRGSRNNSYVQGNGLGLAICQEIIEAHGGIINASNNQDIGSIVTFSIPIKI